MVNGFTLTGSIVGSHYQGGNFWSAYGNAQNQFGNIPFRDVTSGGTAGIGNTDPSFAGDYAPLITTTVYESRFKEVGLPSSSHPTAFSVQVLTSPSGSPAWVNSTATSGTPGGCSAGTVCIRFYLPNGTYEFLVSTSILSHTHYYPHPSIGNFTVAGASVNTTVISFGTTHPLPFVGLAAQPAAARAPGRGGLRASLR
jgi:hypothetical protein